MKNRISINPNTYLRLLFMVPTICIPAFTGPFSDADQIAAGKLGRAKR
jgi:hypothetical protein